MSGARLALTLCVTKARKGSEADLDALKSMFDHLRFNSTMKRDPTAQVCGRQPQTGSSRLPPLSRVDSPSSNSRTRWKSSSRS